MSEMRTDLAAWTVDAVTGLLGPVAAGALAQEQRGPAVRSVRRAVGDGDPLAVLTGLFVLGLDLPRAQVDRAVRLVGTAGLIRAGLVTAAGAGPDDVVRALVDLRPYAAVDDQGPADWWVASDRTGGRGALRADHVLGVGGASVMLADCTVRRHTDRLLDLGTGCAVQSLHAVRHADQVVATDISARALAFARFNLAMNGVPTHQVDLRQGDLLGPVRGETFDAVVSNPPFVITPRVGAVPRYDYRDGGQVGDGVVEHLVTTVGQVLAPGGIAQLLGNWEHRRGEGWRERLGDWLDRSGLHGWIVQREVQDPAEYAQLWIRDGGAADGSAAQALLDAWLDDFEARNVEAIGFGVITLWRPDGGAAADPFRPAIHRVEEQRGPAQAGLGAHLARCLAAIERWGDGAGDDLLAARLTVHPDVTEERHYRPGEEDPQVIVLRQGGGLGRAIRVDTALAGLVGACDGDLTVGQICAALGHLLELTDGQVQEQVLPGLRELLFAGMLTPAAD